MFETNNITEMWEIMIEYIPEKDKQMAADHLMPFIVNLELPESEFQKLVSSDQYLEEAALEYVEDEEDEDNDLYANDEW